MEIKPTGKINNAGTHTECNEKTLEYGISKGYYWYYCHTCKKFVEPYERPEELSELGRIHANID